MFNFREINYQEVLSDVCVLTMYAADPVRILALCGMSHPSLSLMFLSTSELKKPYQFTLASFQHYIDTFQLVSADKEKAGNNFQVERRPDKTVNRHTLIILEE